MRFTYQNIHNFIFNYFQFKMLEKRNMQLVLEIGKSKFLLFITYYYFQNSIVNYCLSITGCRFVSPNYKGLQRVNCLKFMTQKTKKKQKHIIFLCLEVFSLYSP